MSNSDVITHIGKLKMSLIFIFLLIALPCFGQQDPIIQFMQECISDASDRVHNWRFLKQLGLGLTITVGVLGATLTAFQKIENNSYKWIALFIGLIISVITIVINIAFDGDFRTYKNLSNEGSAILIRMKTNLALAQQENNKDNKLELLKLIHEDASTLCKLENFTLGTDKRFKENQKEVSLHDHIFASSVFAGQNMPEWIQKLPTTEGHLYFIGKGSDRELRKARDLASNNAKENCIGYFQNSLHDEGVDIYKLSRLLSSTLTQEDSYIHYNSQTNVYDCYYLMLFDKKATKINLKYFELANNMKLSNTVYSTVNSLKQSEYFERSSSSEKELFFRQLNKYSKGLKTEAIKLAFDLKLKNIPYKFGGKTEEEGLDTSGFVSYILGKIGILPNYKIYWSEKLMQIYQAETAESIETWNMETGDLVFYELGYVMFYLWDNKVIGMTTRGVVIEDLSLESLGVKCIGYSHMLYDLN